MVEGLLSMQQPEDRMGEWQRAWDKMDNGHMEGEGEPFNAYAVLQLKRPDAWRPVGGKLALSLQDTDTYKTPLEDGVVHPTDGL
jgi:hypothetical protein